MTRDNAREAAGAAALVLAGVGLRLAVAAAFPTEPVSDFRGLVLFGVRLRDEGLAVPGWHWVQFSPGLPLILSLLFRVFPHGVAAVARSATAVAAGLVAVVPYVLWRPILARRWRLLAGALLALWPGQVLFSSVPAQENWALLPTVALACLAARRLRDPGGGAFPAGAGLLFAAAGAIRQELLVVMVPPALAAAGLPGSRTRRGTRLLALVLAAGVPLLALAWERRAATGRFSLTTEHGGLGALGTVVPGAASAGWLDPTLYAASLDAGYLKEPPRLRRDAWRLAARELERRWRFHAFRAAVSGLALSVESERQTLFWSLEAPGALSAARTDAGARLARVVGPLLRLELALISGAFAAALLLALSRRDAAMLVLGAAALLKLLVQVLFSPLGRLMVPAIAIELLVVALGAARLGTTATRRERASAAAVTGAVTVLLLAAVPPLRALAVRKDETPPVLARFPLVVAGGGELVDCAVDAGRLSALSGDRAWLAPLAGGAAARVTCRLSPARVPDTLSLDVAAADPARLRIEADGREATRDEPPAVRGWWRIPVARPGEAAPSVLVVAGEEPFGFGLVRSSDARPPLPRDRELP